MTYPPADNADPLYEEERRVAPRSDAARTEHHDAIYTLARASEIHDRDTGDHVLRIRFVVEKLASRMDFAERDAESLGYDAMLHDVGKLLVPPPILQKPGRLTEEELEVMRSHTVHGEALLSERPSMRRAAVIARSHHECYDGSGYPDGRSGESIPIAARITATADVLDALMSSRAYKKAWSFELAINEVISLAGSKLDPQVVAALRECNCDGSLCDLYRVSPRCAVMPPGSPG